MVAPERKFRPRKAELPKEDTDNPEPSTPVRGLDNGPASMVDFYFLQNPSASVELHIVEKAVEAFNKGETTSKEIQEALEDAEKEWLDFYSAVSSTTSENPLPVFDQLAAFSENKFAKTERELVKQMGEEKAGEVVARFVFFDSLVKQTTEALRKIKAMEELKEIDKAL